MALNQMRTPYSEASHVLVFDASLQQVDPLGLASEEVCMRIFTSGWMRRMWTLQEGALARHLWFQFSNLAVNLDSAIDKVFDNVHNFDTSREGLRRDLITLYRGLRSFFHSKESMPLTDIISVDDALRFRSVSVPTDEALLIGGLLNLDLAHILDGPAESRMPRVWTLISLSPGGIPKSLLFNRGPRLRQMGFRWAPESLLYSRGIPEVITRSRDEAYGLGRLTSIGLNVRVSAFSTAIMASAPRGAAEHPWGAPNENSILCRHDWGIWFRMHGKYSEPDKGKYDPDASSSRESLHKFLGHASQTRRLLLEFPLEFDTFRESSNALLVHDATEVYPDSPRQLVFDVIVRIGKQGNVDQILLEAAYQASRSLLDDEISAQYADLAVEDKEEQRQSPVHTDLGLRLRARIIALAESLDLDDLLSLISEEEIQSLKRLARSLIASFYLGEYCILGPILPSETEWCGD